MTTSTELADTEKAATPGDVFAENCEDHFEHLAYLIRRGKGDEAWEVARYLHEQFAALSDADQDRASDRRFESRLSKLQRRLTRELGAPPAEDRDVAEAKKKERAKRRALGDLDEEEATLAITEDKRMYGSLITSGADVLAESTVKWLVQDRVHRNGVGQVVSAPYVGKTLFAVSLGMSIANGCMDWFGYDLVLGGNDVVVYVAMEGGGAFRQQVDAWVKSHPGTSADNFGLVDERAIDMTSAASVQHLTQEIDAWVGSRRVALVIFDTQLDVMGGLDENSHKVGEAMGQIKLWSSQQDCFCLLLHHTPLEATRARGSGSQFGKDDVQVVLSGSSAAGAPRKVKWTKIKGRPLPTYSDGFIIEKVPGSEGVWAKPVASPGSSVSMMDAVAHEAREEMSNDERAVCITADTGEGGISKRALAKAIGGNTKFALERVDRLTEEGRLTKSKATGRGGGDVYTLGETLEPVDVDNELIPRTGSVEPGAGDFAGVDEDGVG